MSTVAQGRDLADPKTIQDFSEVVQEVSRMRYLLVLTVCDIRAVGPGVWNGWKGQLLRTLYHETELFLNGGFSRTPMKARVEQAKEILATSLEGWSEEDIEAVANLPYSAYYLSTDTDTQVRHMHLLRDMRQNGTSLATDVHTKAFEAITEITVVAPDHPRLLSIITGACSAAGGNIVDAKIHTTTDGMALDSIFITRQYSGDEDEKRRAARIGKMIEEVLSGVTTLPEIIARNISRNQRFKAFSIAPKVEINNTLSNTFSVIEIECLDRPGLLSELTRKLADLNLDIGSAHIITFGEKANDSFYVRDLIGHKIEDEKRIKRIKSELIEVMQPTKTENKNQTQAAVQ